MGKGHVKVPQDAERRQDPCGELTTTKLKRLGRRRINRDNQTGDYKWINIERRKHRLKGKELEHSVPLALFLHLQQTSQRLRINDDLRKRKAGSAGCMWGSVWSFSIYFRSGRITFFFPSNRVV